MEINVIQPKIAKNRALSFWYDGQIATVETDHGIYSLEACGDIRVSFSEEDESNYKDGRAVTRAWDLNLKDKHIINLYNTDAFSNNNWFEVVCIKPDGEVESAAGDVADTYDEAMEMLKTYVEEEYYK